MMGGRCDADARAARRGTQAEASQSLGGQDVVGRRDERRPQISVVIAIRADV